MNIISIDLPWKSEKKGHRTLAIADLAGNVSIETASDDRELLQLARDTAEPWSMVLLDIPIDGFDNLNNKHFRPVDRAMAEQGLPLLPVSKAEKARGERLKENLAKDNKKLGVYEIYPYAIYKFLAYLKDRKLLSHLKLDKFDTLLDDGFRAYWPPKYKRESKRGKRLDNLKYLCSLLMDADIGLNFAVPLPRPEAASNLDRLGDEYDACLGAIAGLYFARNSGYACIAGDTGAGNILLLADRWLAAQLGGQTKLHQSRG